MKIRKSCCKNEKESVLTSIPFSADIFFVAQTHIAVRFTLPVATFVYKSRRRARCAASPSSQKVALILPAWL